MVKLECQNCGNIMYKNVLTKPNIKTLEEIIKNIKCNVCRSTWFEFIGPGIEKK